MKVISCWAHLVEFAAGAPPYCELWINSSAQKAGLPLFLSWGAGWLGTPGSWGTDSCVSEMVPSGISCGTLGKPWNLLNLDFLVFECSGFEYVDREPPMEKGWHRAWHIVLFQYMIAILISTGGEVAKKQKQNKYFLRLVGVWAIALLFLQDLDPVVKVGSPAHLFVKAENIWQNLLSNLHLHRVP